VLNTAGNDPLAGAVTVQAPLMVARPVICKRLLATYPIAALYVSEKLPPTVNVPGIISPVGAFVIVKGPLPTLSDKRSENPPYVFE
jgi:hypothetical protein